MLLHVMDTSEWGDCVEGTLWSVVVLSSSVFMCRSLFSLCRAHMYLCDTHSCRRYLFGGSSSDLYKHVCEALDTVTWTTVWHNVMLKLAVFSLFCLHEFLTVCFHLHPPRWEWGRNGRKSSWWWWWWRQQQRWWWWWRRSDHRDSICARWQGGMWVTTLRMRVRLMLLLHWNEPASYFLFHQFRWHFNDQVVPAHRTSDQKDFKPC